MYNTGTKKLNNYLLRNIIKNIPSSTFETLRVFHELSMRMVK